MSDRLRHGGHGTGIQPRPWPYRSQGAIGAGRPLELLSAREQGRPLPDFECEHGRLPGDRTEPCGCWMEEVLHVAARPYVYRAFRPACACGDLNEPGAVRCSGCGRQLGVTA